MEKAEHGARLRAAMAAKGIDRSTIATVTGRNVRTVTNWTTGQTMPSPEEKVKMRRVLGEYDQPGDPVEIAVRQADLHEWRQDAVLSVYKRHLHEQRGETEERGTAG